MAMTTPRPAVEAPAAKCTPACEMDHMLDPADAAFARLAVEHPECCSTAADYPGWTCGGAS
ncbi:hypothetical protein ACH4GK_32140 [Streptomyces rimosus]|uniref:hypothetical protein n=1 Tax=Streptomyces rimosus TaxID=1927 RepID=UPI0004C7C702|nr:hypothetical protein [Streptomyces rimosus]